jgi:hypothetical protein
MTIQPITPLRQRMIEDMTIRRLKERTQDFLPALCHQNTPSISAARRESSIMSMSASTSCI